MRIELTRAILMPWYSNFLRNSTMHFHMFLYLETHFLRVTVLLLCWLQAVVKIHVPIYPYLISQEMKLFDLVTATATKPGNCNSQEICYQFYTKYKHMQKRIVKSLCLTTVSWCFTWKFKMFHKYSMMFSECFTIFNNILQYLVSHTTIGIGACPYWILYSNQTDESLC